MSASEEAASFRQRLEELAAECRSEQDRVQGQLSEMEMLLRRRAVKSTSCLSESPLLPAAAARWRST